MASRRPRRGGSPPEARWRATAGRGEQGRPAREDSVAVVCTQRARCPPLAPPLSWERRPRPCPRMTLSDLIDLEAQLGRDRDADPAALEARDRRRAALRA